MFSIEKYNKLVPNNNFNFQIIYKKQTNSTNDDALSIINNNKHKEGMIFISDNQKNGRGRHNRLWHTNPNFHLAFSLILCPDIDSKKSGLISIMAGVAVVEGLKKNTDIDFTLKWPNDIIYQNKKVGGILIETKNINSKLVYVIGIGINLNEQLNDFPLEIQSLATSLSIISKKNHSKEIILFQILNQFKNNYNKINSIHSKWISLCSHIDQNITFHLNNQIISGKFMGITQNGHAVININNYNHIFPNGEINL